MTINVKEISEKMQKALADARDIADKSTQEQRDFSDEERTQVADLLKEAKEHKDKLVKAKADDEMRRAVAELGEGIGLVDRDPETNEKARRAKTLGEQFTNSKEWSEWIARMAPGGRFAEKRSVDGAPVLQVKDFGLFPQKRVYGDHEQKEVLTGVTAVSAGALVESERTGIYEPLGRYPLTLRQLVDVRTTMSDTVEFVRQTQQVAQAAAVAESNITTPTGATAEITGEKPEATIRLERVTETVKTIAVWIPATKRALSDASQLRGLIDSELRDDLAEELESQMLTGDGTGENFTGLANTANTLAQAFITDIAVTARKALTNLLVNGKTVPTGWVLNPVDWEAFDLLQDTQGRYYWGGPVGMGERTLWGSPVAQAFLQTAGLGWLANWRKAVLWDREQASVSVSDSHSDFFIRNMVAILAELRAAFGVIRPSAFVEVDLESGS